MNPHRHAASASPEGTVAGQVMAGDRPVPEATVMIIEGDAPHSDLAALTDDTGSFTLGGLTPGRYRIEVRRGDTAVRQQVDIAAGECIWLDVTLAPIT
jgi:hypothetical protein